jgi:membrane protease YdiL (CAAX protease family)
MNPDTGRPRRRTFSQWSNENIRNPYIFLAWAILPLLFFSFEFPCRYVFHPYQVVGIAALLFIGLGLAGSEGRRYERDFFVCAALYLIVQPVSERLLILFIHGSIELMQTEISYLVAIGVILAYMAMRGYRARDMYFARFNPGILAVAALFAVLAWAGLLYFLVTHHDSPEGHLLAALRTLPLPILVIQALSFATFNAFSEEMVFRGIIFGRARPFLGWPGAAWFSALCFAVIHYYGIPWDWWGMFLAFWFGAAMSLLTDQSKSIWPAWLVHFSADLVVFFFYYKVPS